MRKIGAKGRRNRLEMAAARPEVLARGCEFHSYTRGADASWFIRARGLSPICAGPLDAHHARKKGQGGPNDPSNLICLCRRHHDFTEDEPALAREIGLLR